MLRDRAWIARHIPHHGAMCLLDEVLDWDANRARCLSRAHRSPTNPLRSRGQLSTICGIEFAAQAMAVHGALLAPDAPAGRRAGRLVSLRGIEQCAARLDTIENDLVAVVSRIAGDDVTVAYDFSLEAGSRALLTGRAIIVIDPAVAAMDSRQST